MATRTMPVTSSDEANQLLVADPLALLIGMLLDQQVPMEWAFRGPYTLQGRIGPFDAHQIVALGPDGLEAVFLEKPALHRYPVVMARRTYDLCLHLIEHYDGDAAKIWKGTRDAQRLYDRLRGLPGYGDEKAKIFMAILAKRFGKRPVGWEEVAAPFSDSNPRSVADIDSPCALLAVRDWKKAQKAQGKSKSD